MGQGASYEIPLPVPAYAMRTPTISDATLRFIQHFINVLKDRRRSPEGSRVCMSEFYDAFYTRLHAINESKAGPSVPAMLEEDVNTMADFLNLLIQVIHQVTTEGFSKKSKPVNVDSKTMKKLIVVEFMEKVLYGKQISTCFEPRHYCDIGEAFLWAMGRVEPLADIEFRRAIVQPYSVILHHAVPFAVQVMRDGEKYKAVHPSLAKAIQTSDLLTLRLNVWKKPKDDIIEAPVVLKNIMKVVEDLHVLLHYCNEMSMREIQGVEHRLQLISRQYPGISKKIRTTITKLLGITKPKSRKTAKLLESCNRKLLPPQAHLRNFVTGLQAAIDAHRRTDRADSSVVKLETDWTTRIKNKDARKFWESQLGAQHNIVDWITLREKYENYFNNPLSPKDAQILSGHMGVVSHNAPVSVDDFNLTCQRYGFPFAGYEAASKRKVLSGGSKTGLLVKMSEQKVRRRGRSNNDMDLREVVQSSGLDGLKKAIEYDYRRLLNQYEDGQNIMHFAAFLGDIEILSYLLDHIQQKPPGSRLRRMPDQVDSYNYAPIHYAIAYGHKACAEFLQLFTDPETVSNYPLLHAAASSGDIATVKWLVEEVGVEINALDKKQQSGLFHAALNGNGAVVKYLIDRGANINESQDESNRGSIMTAAIDSDNENIVNMLIESGLMAKPRKKHLRQAAAIGTPGVVQALSRDEMKSQTEAMLVAVENGNMAAVRSFLSADPDTLEVMDNEDSRPLHLAAGDGDMQMTHTLVSAGANVNAQNIQGNSPVMLAIQNGEEKMAENLLIECEDIDLNLQNNEKQTALHLCVERGMDATTGLLLEKGADTDIQDKNGKTPVLLACEHKRSNAVALLLKHDADLTIPDKDGKNPIIVSSINQDAQILKSLINHDRRKGSRALKKAQSSLNAPKKPMKRPATLPPLPPIVQVDNQPPPGTPSGPDHTRNRSGARVTEPDLDFPPPPLASHPPDPISTPQSPPPQTPPPQTPPSEKKEAPRSGMCGVCGGPITSAHVSTKSGTRFHYGCLKCHSCRTELKVDDSIVLREGNYFHAECVNARGTEARGAKPDSSGSLRQCQGCDEPLEGSQVANVGGSFYHIKCFKCSICQGAITKAFLRRDGKPIHPECGKGGGNSCPVCHKPLRGWVVTVQDQKYHRDCFKCAHCDRALGEGYFLRNGIALCTECRNNMPASPQRSQNKPDSHSANVDSYGADGSSSPLSSEHPRSPPVHTNGSPPPHDPPPQTSYGPSPAGPYGPPPTPQTYGSPPVGSLGPPPAGAPQTNQSPSSGQHSQDAPAGFGGPQLRKGTDNEYALALYDYNKTSAQELSFFAGDVLKIIDKHENGWFYCALNKGFGYVPSTYLELLES